MDGEKSVAPGAAHRRVVRLPDGEILNRYWDERDTPREESYGEDVATAGQSTREAQQVYRDLRAAAESGWDFSSRWLEDAQALHSIRTTSILPIDLNSFLYKLETTIAQLSAPDDTATATDFTQKAAARKTAISKYMWDEAAGAFFDFDWPLNRKRENLTVATAATLYVRLATQSQAETIAATLAARLVKEGGVATTEVDSEQQWDEPNGWAPMQWLTIRGLAHYGQSALSADIAHRWLTTVARLYSRESKLVEKYALYPMVAEATAGGGGRGGEYPLQDGFGWTNGVTRRLLQEYPQHAACASRAAETAPAAGPATDPAAPSASVDSPSTSSL